MKKEDLLAIGIGGIIIYFLHQNLHKVKKVVIKSKIDFVKIINPIAIKIYQKYQIRPIISLSQSALESGWGQSELAIKSNNLFGIKADEGWIRAKKPYVTHITTEYQNGKEIRISSKFRKYKSFEESFSDWANFLRKARYKKLLEYAKQEKIEDFGKEVIRSGYATNPNYATIFVWTARDILKILKKGG